VAGFVHEGEGNLTLPLSDMRNRK